MKHRSDVPAETEVGRVSVDAVVADLHRVVLDLRVATNRLERIIEKTREGDPECQTTQP